MKCPSSDVFEQCEDEKERGRARRRTLPPASLAEASCRAPFRRPGSLPYRSRFRLAAQEGEG
jgi:hypothetical protein